MFIFCSKINFHFLDWLLEQKIQKMAMVISNVTTKEVLERWDFKLQYDGASDSNPDSVGNKELSVIQKEIRDVLRQICSTVSFLPLLDCPCAFDLQIYTKPDVDVPQEWAETAPSYIANSQELQLRSFSTSFHKMDTIVSYKADF